ncbi:hypothetical protein [Dactylosporangium sp. CA-092794]|uniref:hypothetical protein n=1 Tax=Dactylosporangium sp. CA-092794 TaxID=3239929 RepID=UPI003D917009
MPAKVPEARSPGAGGAEAGAGSRGRAADGGGDRGAEAGGLADVTEMADNSDMSDTVNGAAQGDGEPARRQLSAEWARRFDIGLLVAGLIVTALLAAGLAIIEALFSPLRIGGFRVPVSLVLAVVTNPLLGWFAFATSRRRFAALVPAAVWCTIWIIASGRTSEGDLILTNDNWVGLLTLFVGSLVFAIGIYLSTLRHRIGPSRPKAGGA